MGPRADRENSRHLLYLAFWYPPSRASGVYRALATSDGFIRAGWDVTVITVSTEFLEDEVGSTDPSLSDEIPPQVAVERVPFTFWDGGGRDIRETNWLLASFPHLRRLGSPRSDRPDRYARWVDPTVDKGVDIASSKTVDHVLATGNPFSSFEAARLIADRLQSPFSVDFRDPWTFDVFTGSRLGDAQTHRMESRIVHDAWACFHVNQAIADVYAVTYPEAAEKQVVVPNGFDESSIGPVREPSHVGPVRIGSLGTITERWPIETMLDGWSEAESEMPPGSEFVLAGHLGYFAHSSEYLRQRLRTTANAKYVGPVEKSRVASFYQSLDIVVVPVPGGPMVTSGKIYEALALGIPLICLQPEGGGARHLVDDHPLAFAVEPNATSFADALLKAVDTARSTTKEQAKAIRRKMGRFERHRAVAHLVDTVERSM